MDTRYVNAAINLEECVLWRFQPGDDFRPTGRLERDCQDIADIYEVSDARVLEADLKRFSCSYPFDPAKLLANLPWEQVNDRSHRAQVFLFDVVELCKWFATTKNIDRCRYRRV